MLGLKSRPSIKQRRRPIITFRDLVGFKKTTMLGRKSRPSIDILVEPAVSEGWPLLSLVEVVHKWTNTVLLAKVFLCKVVDDPDLGGA